MAREVVFMFTRRLDEPEIGDALAAFDPDDPQSAQRLIEALQHSIRKKQRQQISAQHKKLRALLFTQLWCTCRDDKR